MPLEATLHALLVPSGTEFPGAVQELLDLIAQYMEITGLNPFNGINYGSTTPTSGNRDRPWFKTFPDGSPIGWYSWQGSSWELVPATLPSGDTAGRPSSPPPGTQYLDTTINVALIFERSQWRTLAGSPGDVKHVKATTIEEALLRNPGWEQDQDSLGRVIGSAGAGSGLTSRAYGVTVGREEVLLAEENMPAHTHGYSRMPQSARWKADGNATDPAGNLASFESLATSLTDQTGGDTPVNLINPTIYFWTLVKL